jgi:hypothetical protein
MATSAHLIAYQPITPAPGQAGVRARKVGGGTMNLDPAGG